VVNLLHLCEVMTNCWLEESELRVPIEVFRKFAKRNNFIIEKKSFDGVIKYKLKRKKIPIHFISGEEKTEFKFMDLADLHIGNKKFDGKALRNKLQSAVDGGIRVGFIAGDVFEGCIDGTTHTSYLEQVMLAYYIFRDYPQLTYYVINGNHEYSFEQIGLPNPIRRLEAMLKEEGIKFHFFDVYLMDFVICGVIKRVMHVERQDFNKKRIFAALKIKSFDEEGNLYNKFNGKIYQVRFFLVGHIHVNVQMYYAKKKVFISQPGSFLKSECVEERANIIRGRVIENKIFMT